MAAWSFRDALAELEVKNRFDESMLQSMQGLCMGDICFAEIQTTFRMHAVSFHLFLQFIERGVSTPINCQRTVTVIPWPYSWPSSQTLHLTDIECVGIGNVI